MYLLERTLVSGIISLCGVIYGLRALVALWFVWRSERARQWKQRRKLQLLAIAEEREAKEEERALAEREEKEEERDPAERDGKYPVPVFGPPQFRQSVDRVLSELTQFVPHRYQKVAFLPKIEYVERSKEYDFAGRSDGLFTIDGTGNIPLGNGRYRVNDYEWFRFVVLHELGHCLGHYSEQAADDYAHLVLQELAQNKSSHPP